jgi:hypothetical protein
VSSGPVRFDGLRSDSWAMILQDFERDRLIDRQRLRSAVARWAHGEQGRPPEQILTLLLDLVDAKPARRGRRPLSARQIEARHLEAELLRVLVSRYERVFFERYRCPNPRGAALERVAAKCRVGVDALKKRMAHASEP